MTQQGPRCYSSRMCNTYALEITRKSLFSLHHSELACMEQSQAGTDAHNLL